MGSSGDPSLVGMVIGFICIAPWVVLAYIALADKPRNQAAQPEYREIQPRDLGTADERAGFVQAKLEKIERASR